MASPNEKTLYQRMGGYDVVAGVIDDLLSSLRADPRFQRFGMGRSVDSHNRARQLLVDQMAALAGGPVVYIGRDMKSSHAGLAITMDEWEINLAYTRAALDKFKIPAQEQAEFIVLFERYKSEIVEK
jgi:hemoglobin